jgi:hypothetical protein
MTIETDTTASAASLTETTKNEIRSAGAAKFTFDELAKYREEAITDNLKLRDKNNEYKKQVEQLQTEAREGAEAKEQLTKIAQQTRERVAKAEFRALLKSAGIDDPDVLKIVPLETVEYDEEGDPKNVDAVWEKFRESKKYLFSEKAPANTSTSSVRKAPEAKQVEEDMSALSDEEFAERRAAQRRRR